MRSPWDDEHDDPPTKIDEVIELFQTQWDAVVAFSRGKERLGWNKAKYVRRKRQLGAALAALGLKDPFRWDEPDDVWAFAKRAAGTYDGRQHEISKLAQPVADALEAIRAGSHVADWGGESEWAALEERLDGLKREVETAGTLDEFQDVGRRSREIVIAATSLVFDPSMVPAGEDQPQAANAKAKIDLILETYKPGEAHQELRALLRAAEKLTQKVTHSESTNRVDAFAAAQAALLLVRTLGTMHRYHQA